MDDHIASTSQSTYPAEISFSDDTDTATSYTSSTRAAGNKSGRGRKRDDSLPYNRARDTQREFRARRQAHLEELEERNLELELENEQLRAALEMKPSSRRPIGTGPTGLGKPRLPVSRTRAPAKIEPGDASEVDCESESGSVLSTPFDSPHSTALVPVTLNTSLSPSVRPLPSPGESIPRSTGGPSCADYAASTMAFHHSSNVYETKDDPVERTVTSWPVRRHTMASTTSVLSSSGSHGWDCDHASRSEGMGQVESPLEAGLRLEASRRPRTDAFVVLSTHAHHDHLDQATTTRHRYPPPSIPSQLPRFDSTSPYTTYWGSHNESPQYAIRQRSYSQRYETSSNDFGLIDSHNVDGMPLDMHFPSDSTLQQRPLDHSIAVPEYTQRMDTYSQDGQQQF